MSTQGPGPGLGAAAAAAPAGDTLESLLGPSTTATHQHQQLHHNPHRHALRHDTSSSSLNSTISSSSSTTSQPGLSGPHLTALRSIPIRLIQYGVSILLRIRAILPASLRPWFWVGLWLVFAVIGVGIFAGFHTRIFELLESLATFIKGLGRAGPPIIMLGLFLTAFPPMFGYSSLVTMSGYVYGFTFGLFIAYTSALLGSIACFYLCRRWFKVQVRALMAKKQGMKSVVKAVEKRGFKLMVLIRLAPYPFNVMNALLSATHIPLSTFALATAISLTKLALHVYIGSTLSSLATLPPVISPSPPISGDDGTTPPSPDEPTIDNNSHGRNLKIMVMVFSMILGIAVGAYVWIVAKREIAASEGIRIERRRKRRESLRLSRASMRSSSLNNGGVAGRGSARAENHLLPRNGSSGGLDLLGVDLGAGGSDFVGGAIMMNEYQDEDEGQEDQALVGGGFHATGPIAAASSLSEAIGGGRLEYGTDSDDSDLGDDEEDMSDMERGVVDQESFLQGGTEMDVRSTSSQHQQTLRGTSHDTMGWFAQNGVDISDHGW